MTIANKTKSWIAGAMMAAAFTVPAFSQVSVGVRIGPPPPPLRVETRPIAPGPDYEWIDGYWNWAGGRYVWVGGRWDRRPYAGAVWEHPHYDHYHDGWHYHEGHWRR